MPWNTRPSRNRVLGAPPIEILAPSLSDEAVEAFRTDVRVISAVYERIREGRGLPDGVVRLVLADDFDGEVQRPGET
jgi:hypothetical protein